MSRVCIVWCREDLRRDATNKEVDIAHLVCQILAEGHILSPSTPQGKRRTLLFDCRSMYEPQSIEHREHYGTHPSIFNHYFIRRDGLTKHVVELISKLTTLHWSVSSLTLVVFDAKGRHAAMAVAKVFAEICLRADCLTLQRITYLSHESDVDCGMCPQCSFWSRASAPRNDLITQICNQYGSKLWSSRAQ